MPIVGWRLLVREDGWSSNSNQEIAAIGAQSFMLPPTRSAPPILCEKSSYQGNGCVLTRPFHFPSRQPWGFYTGRAGLLLLLPISWRRHSGDVLYALIW